MTSPSEHAPVAPGDANKADSAIKYNRLINETSPYLLQHADNPVDWCPWGSEAFARAKAENKPIFLSIGYSTCHWCHVMAHESFEEPEVARLMNSTFINIKVDREERPDIDNLYMNVCQMMTGSGGWPLTIIMTPDQEPFFAGTYFPRESRWGRIGMLELVPRIGEIWATRRQEVLNTGDQIAANLRSAGAESGEISTESLSESTLELAYLQLARSYDETYGGFGAAPKFPTPHNLLFLLRYWKRTGEEKALQMVEKTLQEMRRGGIYDHIGLGFHRYSTDQPWLLPHFEKMLYDQALLAMAYTEAFQATRDEDYARTARQIFTYVLRDLTSPEGGFYCAEDADSEGEEGKFYLWTIDDIRGVLGQEDANLVIRTYNLAPDGNFSEEASGRKTGANILHLKKSPADIADELGIPISDLEHRLEAARQQLFAARQKRVRPQKDDKILTDWNGLMIAALARAARAFDEPSYSQVALFAVQFILKQLRTPQGRLLHRYRDGDAGIMGNLDDYAFLIWGLIELYEATFEIDLLETALELNRDLIDHFWDDQAGGFYFAADDAETLLVRTKEVYDGAVPSGNSAAMLNLLRLARMTGDTELEKKAHFIGRTFASQVKRSPAAYTHLMAAVEFGVGPAYEVVIAGDPRSEDTQQMLKALRRRFLPNKVVLLHTDETESVDISRLAPFARNLSRIGGKATAYICQHYACSRPTTNPDEMLQLLR